jgi:uncharacterized phage-associated protein
MPSYHHREKLLNAIIYFAKHTKYCGKTKLYKLLYYLDFTHFKETGRSVTGLEYYAWDHGPAPKALHEELKNMPADINSHMALIGSADSFTNIKPKKQFDGKYFTKREIRILNTLCEIYLEAKASDMEEVSHLENEPWDVTRKKKGMYAGIDYFLALDNAKESLNKQEVEERIKDKEQLESAFR